MTKKQAKIAETIEIMRDLSRIKAVKCLTKGEEIFFRTDMTEKSRLAFKAIDANIPY